LPQQIGENEGKVIVEDLDESKNIKLSMPAKTQKQVKSQVIVIDPKLKEKEDQFYKNLSNQHKLKEWKLKMM
jgi:hypothetical protein